MLKNELYEPWANGDNWGISFLKDPFQGLVIQINNIEFSKAGDSSVDLDFTTVVQPDWLDKDCTKTEEFTSVMSKILSDVLTEAISLHDNEQNRTDNT